MRHHFCQALSRLASFLSEPRCLLGDPRGDEQVARYLKESVRREAILTMLQRPEVRQIAEKAGVSIDKVTSAVATLEGQDLREIASHARQVNNEVAGGATIVITTTTIIIILLIIILIVVAVD